jgi:hypothetical protein
LLGFKVSDFYALWCLQLLPLAFTLCLAGANKSVIFAKF